MKRAELGRIRTIGWHRGTMLLPGSSAAALVCATALSAIPARAVDRLIPPGSQPTAAAAPAVRFAGLKYRLVGPFRGSRADSVSGDPRNPRVYYAGFASSGLWKTVDAGQTWQPLWDRFPAAAPAVGAVAVAPSSPEVVYAGTGEPAIRGDAMAGNGLFKSTDAGKTWKPAGLAESGVISRIAVAPDDPNTLLVAALGHPFGANQERGIFRSADGGATWQKTLFVHERSGAVDVQYDPANPKIVYAGMWQMLRQPWSFSSGGQGSGLYRSEDGGGTWRKLTGHGLPEGILGRIGVAPTADPNKVYALIEAKEGGLFRTDDGGQSWQRINSENRFRQRAWYFTNLFSDPKDPNTVYILNTSAYRSSDGGNTFKELPITHGDAHGLWINPGDPSYMACANDGGATVSVDGGRTWSTQANQPTAQIYHIAVDNRVPFHLYGAQQDNDSIDIPSTSRTGRVIGFAPDRFVGGGESGFVVPKLDDPSIVLGTGYEGSVTLYDERTQQVRSIDAWTHERMGWAPQDMLHRAQWTAPIVPSPFDPNTFYYANEVLFRTTDLGRTWKTVSPDLTRNDKSKQQASGGPLTRDNTSIETYDTIFSMVESPLQKGLIWAGTDDGLIQLTRDGGAHWENVTPKAMPEWGTVDMVEADPHRPGTAYIAVERHKMDDNAPHAFRTDDYGRTWVSITSGLPADGYVHVVRADPTRAGLLYAGTEQGIYVSWNDGAEWESLQLNLPRAPVADLVVKDNDLAVATHGRSFWVLDNLTPIRQWKPEIPQDNFHLFAPPQTPRLIFTRRSTPSDAFGGANPPDGVMIDYYLRTATPSGEAKDAAAKTPRVQLSILDAQDHVVAHYPAAPTLDPENDIAAGGGEDEGPRPIVLPQQAGLNRFAWNMHYMGARPIPHSAMWGASLEGPVALPGHYKIVLTVDGRSQTRSLDLLPDPQLDVTPQQLREQFDLSQRIVDELTKVEVAILEMRSVHRQLAAIRARVKTGAVKDGASLLQQADALETAMDPIEDEMIQRKAIAFEDPLAFPIRLNNMVGSLNGKVNHGVGAPTATQYQEFDSLRSRADLLLGRWAQLRKTNLVTFNITARTSAVTEVEPVALF